MTTLQPSLESVSTLADMVDRLGNVPLDRIHFRTFGRATVRDVISQRQGPAKRMYELVEKVLVEKTMGALEALLAMHIGHLICSYNDEHNLGVVLGADGMLKLWNGRIRIPDVSFISWERIPGDEFPSTPVPNIIPDLVVEVLSESNTEKEIEIKLKDYFKSGVLLAWIIDPKTCTAEVYTSATDPHHIGKSGTLDGGEVLPGFHLPLKKLFAKSKKRPSN